MGKISILLKALRDTSILINENAIIVGYDSRVVLHKSMKNETLP